MSTTEDLDLVVTSRRMLTPTVAEFALADPRGEALPPFEPGAHLSVNTPSGEWRNYSLTGSAQDRHQYVIAVRRDARGRGGSISMVDHARTGMSLRAKSTGNGFPLRSAERYVLIAGGIGITPLRAMFHELLQRGAPVHLIYLNRSRAETAYLEDLTAEGLAGSVTLHFDDESAIFDLWPVIAEPSDRTAVYCCGPARSWTPSSR